MELYAFAFLPFALLSLFARGNHRATAGFGFLAALAPVVASGVKSLIGHKQKQSAEKKQIEYERQQHMAAEAQKRAAFEAQQNSPQAALQRQAYNLKLGKLLGKAGGRDKLPPSLLAGLDAARRVQEYTPGAGYVAPPTSSAGGWDLASGITDALDYFDYEKLKKPRVTTPPIANTPFRTGQLASLIRPQNPNFASGTKDFG